MSNENANNQEKLIKWLKRGGVDAEIVRGIAIPRSIKDKNQEEIIRDYYELALMSDGEVLTSNE